MNSESSRTSPEQDGAITADVLELGKMLASELEQTDTLGRWIAHYLAERMIRLERIASSERVTAEAEIVDLILRLWAQRRQLPGDRLPLAEVDEVEAAIARLAPKRLPWGYFGSFPIGAEPSTEETVVNKNLKAALSVDQLAGDLVHGLIGYAAEIAQENDVAWIKHAEKIGDEPLQIIRRLHFPDDESEGMAESSDWNSLVKKRALALSSAVADLLAALDNAASTADY